MYLFRLQRWNKSLQIVESCNKENSLQLRCGIKRSSKNTSKHEDEPKEKGPEKMDFELKNEGSDSFEQESSESDDEVELQTPTLGSSNHVRRPIESYSPPNFRYVFVLSIVNDEPRSVKEAISYEECILWKKSMVEETEALEKNEA